MQTFDIRLFNSDGTLSHKIKRRHQHVIAAIADARCMAGSAPFEVWSGQRRVYMSATKVELFPDKSRGRSAPLRFRAHSV